MGSREDGERVIASSRRPDGTLRKERKIRPGFVPQEEQQVYVSRGATFRDAAKHHVPGVDPAKLAAAKAANKSRSAKKNQKRKEKKATEQATGAGGASRSADDTAAHLQQLSLNGGGRPDASGAAVPIAPRLASAAHDPAAVERQIRALKKKLRQCEVLQRERDQGKELTAEEVKKLERMAEWTEEVLTVEQQAV